jgi:hypothetical protein
MLDLRNARLVKYVRIMMPLLACVLFVRLSGLDVDAIRNGTFDIAEIQRRYAGGDRASALVLACANAYGVGVPLNETKCVSLLYDLSKAIDIDTLLNGESIDASGFTDYVRSLALEKNGWWTPESLRLLRNAADKGFALAMCDLALYQRIGRSRGGLLNAQATCDRLEAAARAGSLKALIEMWNTCVDEVTVGGKELPEAKQRCLALAEPLLLKSISETDRETNLKIADQAFKFGLQALAESLLLRSLSDTDHKSNLKIADQAHRFGLHALAESLLLKSLSDTDHESNLKIADQASQFGLHPLSHRIRLAAVQSGLSAEHCELQNSLRQLAWISKTEKDRLKAAKPKPALQPELQPDELAMIATPMAAAWSADLARFHVQEMREISRRHGQRGAWGERIDFVINLAARYMSGVIGFPTKSQLSSKLYELIKAGCEDPAVGYLYFSLFGDDLYNDHVNSLIRIYEALKAQDAPLYLRVDCAERICWRSFLMRSSPEREERLTRFLPIFMDEAVQALRRPMRGPQERVLSARVLGVSNRTFVIQDWHLRCFAVLKEAIANDVASAPTIDPWLSAMVEGQILLCEGWKVRGTGYASSVKKEEWKIFHEHLDRARDQFERAHAIDPSLPDAATFRITVAMGRGEDLPAVMTWLDKATAIVPGNRSAYLMAMEAAAPRWGGSTAAMVAVGRRGVATNAYDTAAPLQLLNAIEEASKEAQDKRNGIGPAKGVVGFSKPFWPEIRTVLQTYIDRTEDPLLRRWHQTALVAYSYKFDHADEVQDLLKGPLRGQIITVRADEILQDWYILDQLLAAAGQE